MTKKSKLGDTSGLTPSIPPTGGTISPISAQPPLSPSPRKPSNKSNPPRTEEDKEKSNEALLRKVEHLTKNIEHVNAVVIFGFIVLLIMVAQIIIEGWRSKTDSYNNLEDKIYQMEFERRIQQQSFKSIESNYKINNSETVPYFNRSH